MASGIVYQKAALMTATGAAALSIASTAVFGPEAIGIAIGAYTAVLIEPDLDHHVITRSERTLLRFNRLLGWLFIAYWWPYEKIMPHRSRWSHLPFVATGIRLLYAFWWAVLLWPHDFWLWMWLGMSITDMAHFVMDEGKVY